MELPFPRHFSAGDQRQDLLGERNDDNLICLNATIPTPHGDIVVIIDREKQITNISYPKECTCITLEKPPKGETTYEFS